METAQQDERRRFTRVSFDANATISQGYATYETHLIDISLKGVLLETPSNYELRANEPASLEIKLADATRLHMKVMLVHSSNNMLGFHCESIDMDSIAHLRRLIELNMDSPNAADRVLEELLAPHNAA